MKKNEYANNDFDTRYSLSENEVVITREPTEVVTGDYFTKRDINYPKLLNNIENLLRILSNTDFIKPEKDSKIDECWRMVLELVNNKESVTKLIKIVLNFFFKKNSEKTFDDYFGLYVVEFVRNLFLNSSFNLRNFLFNHVLLKISSVGEISKNKFFITCLLSLLNLSFEDHLSFVEKRKKLKILFRGRIDILELSLNFKGFHLYEGGKCEELELKHQKIINDLFVDKKKLLQGFEESFKKYLEDMNNVFIENLLSCEKVVGVCGEIFFEQICMKVLQENEYSLLFKMLDFDKYKMFIVLYRFGLLDCWKLLLRYFLLTKKNVFQSFWIYFINDQRVLNEDMLSILVSLPMCEEVFQFLKTFACYTHYIKIRRDEILLVDEILKCQQMKMEIVKEMKDLFSRKALTPLLSKLMSAVSNGQQRDYLKNYENFLKIKEFAVVIGAGKIQIKFSEFGGSCSLQDCFSENKKFLISKLNCYDNPVLILKIKSVNYKMNCVVGKIIGGNIEVYQDSFLSEKSDYDLFFYEKFCSRKYQDSRKRIRTLFMNVKNPFHSCFIDNSFKSISDDVENCEADIETLKKTEFFKNSYEFQKKAYKKIISKNAVIVEGIQGSGKTTILSYIAKFLTFENNNFDCILVTCITNQSANEVIKKLNEITIDKERKRIVRLTALTYENQKEIEKIIYKYTLRHHFNELNDKLVTFTKFCAKKISESRIIVCTIDERHLHKLRKKKIKCEFIEEFSQVSPYDLPLALSVLDVNKKDNWKFVAFGDSNQLGYFVHTYVDKLLKNYFCLPGQLKRKFWEVDLYVMMEGTVRFDFELYELIERIYKMLDVKIQCFKESKFKLYFHKSIQSNVIFLYHDFIHTKGDISKNNKEECLFIKNLISHFKKKYNLSLNMVSKTFGIICYYKNQLRSLKKNLKGVVESEMIRNIDSTQGAGFKIGVLSMCLDLTEGLGFQDDPRRTGVAIGRSIDGLIIIGNKSYLNFDYHHLSVLGITFNFIKEKGLFLPIEKLNELELIKKILK